MFTGIVEAVGTLQSREGNLFTISHTFEEDFKIGESISLNGMCSTVIKNFDQKLQVEIMQESRDKTTFGSAQTGDVINLERSAVTGQRNSGHNVTGHIDQVGKIVKSEKVSDFQLLRVGIHPENRKYLVMKGSVALDGISLTISDLGPDWLEVSLISHTWEQTNLREKQVGDGINIEFDILGKYILNQDA